MTLKKFVQVDGNDLHECVAVDYCPCGCRGPWATTVRRAIEVWNDRSKP